MNVSNVSELKGDHCIFSRSFAFPVPGGDSTLLTIHRFALGLASPRLTDTEIQIRIVFFFEKPVTVLFFLLPSKKIPSKRDWICKGRMGKSNRFKINKNVIMDLIRNRRRRFEVARSS